MQEILTYLQENWTTLLTGTGLAALGTYALIWIKGKLVPMLINKAAVVVAKLISNMFGTNTDEADPLVEALPFVNEFKTAIANMQAGFVNGSQQVSEALTADMELRLLDLKQKLASPLFSAIEKVPMQAAFNEIYNRVKNSLPPSIIEAIALLDQIAERG